MAFIEWETRDANENICETFFAVCCANREEFRRAGTIKADAARLACSLILENYRNLREHAFLSA